MGNFSIHDLDDNLITSEGVRVLMSNAWPSLKFLSICTFYYHIETNKIGDLGVDIIMNKMLTNLKSLWISKNDITPAGIRHMMDFPTSTCNITSLELGKYL